MATSGQTFLVKTCQEVIREAFAQLNIIAQSNQGTTLNGDFAADGKIALNNFLKTLQRKRLPWLNRTSVLFLEKEKRIYTLGANADKACAQSDLIDRKTTAAALAAQAVVSCDVASLAVGMQAGVELDNGSLFWSTIAVIGAASVTLAGNLTAAAASGNKIYFCTEFITDLPLVINSIQREEDSTQIPLQKYSRERYMGLSSKNTASSPNIYYYSHQLLAGDLYLNPVPENPKDYLNIDYVCPIQVCLNLTDDLEIPDDWYNYIELSTALQLANKYSISNERLQRIKQESLEQELILFESRELAKEPMLYGRSY